MAKPKKNDDRRARLEAMRREAERAERRRTMAVVGICAVVGIAIIGATAFYLITQDESAATTGETVDGGSVGESGTAAGCDNIMLRAADGSNEHVEPPIEYPHAPPAFGSHTAETAPLGVAFYAEDRPLVENLVHNLEHGYTILWYDETIADDPEALAQVQAIAEPFAGRQDASGKFIAAPWTGDDGDAFPEGKHVALTHWSVQGEAATSGQGQGDWLYCTEPSADVVADFMAKFPPSDALEPNAA